MRRLVPAYAGAMEEGRPIADLNMTPLIDVLLVLIVMFIMVIPAMTNEVPVVLPGPSTAALPVTTHRLVVARDGAVMLDGVGVSDSALGVRLGAIGREERATLVMRTDPAARYERFLAVLALVKRAGVVRLGFEDGLGSASAF